MGLGLSIEVFFLDGSEMAEHMKCGIVDVVVHECPYGGEISQACL
jgi:hypothetical protein